MKFEALRLTGRPTRIWIALFAAFAILVAATFLMVTRYRHGMKRAQDHFATTLEINDIKSAGSDDLGGKALLRLCEENQLHSNDYRHEAHEGDMNSPEARRLIDLGIKRAERLLPLAKKLVIDSLRELPADLNASADEVVRAEHFVNNINSVVLDMDLDDAAEFEDDEPATVRIGPGYALFLETDEETIMLLGHELTHAAEQERNLNEFVRTVTAKVESDAGVYPGHAQRHDLTCDFIGEQVLKRFIKQNPSKESSALRFSHALDYNCDDDQDDSDDEHLSQDDTLKALLSLDPELNRLILGETAAKR